MEYITIQEVAKILGCSTRSVYRKFDKIDTLDNLIKKGFAKRELSNNGNSRRLFNKDWISSNFVKIDKPRQSKTSSLDVKAFEIFENQLEIKDNQIESLQENLKLSLHRIAELQKYFHINGIENGPTLTPTKEYLNQHPESTLNYEKITNDSKDVEQEDSNSIDPNNEKDFSEWLKSFR